MRNLVDNIRATLKHSDVDRLISTLGGSKKEDTSEFNIYSTVCHCGNSYKLYYYKSSKNFYCYSNCGSMDLFGLVEQVYDIDFKQAVSYLAKFLNIQNSLAPVGFGNQVYQEQANNQNQDAVVEEVKLPTFNLNVLNLFLDFHCTEWLSEGISVNTMKKYSIKYFLDQHKIIVPHFNLDGELVGIRGRALLQEDLDRGQKYMPIFIGKTGYAHSLMHNLYGLNFNKEAIKLYKKVVVFEGEKSVLIMDTWYGEGSCAVAVCGSKLHKAHIKQLSELGVEEIIIAFDKQYKTIEDKELWEKKVLKFTEYLYEGCTVSAIWDDVDSNLISYKDAPVDGGIVIFEHLLKNRKTIYKNISY